MRSSWSSASHVLIIAALFLTAATPNPSPAGSGWAAAVVESYSSGGEPEVPTNQIIITYTSNADLRGNQAPDSRERIRALSTAAGVQLDYFRAMSGGAHVLRLPSRWPISAVDDIAKRLAALPEIEYAEPDRLMFPALTPNDPRYTNQWHYFETYGINAPAAWDITTGSSGVQVAVLDTGITDHIDLAGRWVGGYDFVTDAPTANDGGGRDSDAHDPGDWITVAESGNSSGPFFGCPVTNSTWHGTHVAGTIGAASHNHSGVAGINWVSKIVPVRVLGKCGGYISDIADGMRWAAGLPVSGVPANASPAKVLNLSLSGPGLCSSTYQNAVDAINAAGAIIVAAAGNSGANASSYQPGNCNGVITVAATDRGGDKALYSNFGTVIEISAPGGETFTSPSPQNGVLSTLNTGLTAPAADMYSYYQGTSLAAPHVAGVVSLMVSISSTLNFTQSLQILQDTARAFPGGSGCNTSNCGSGIVDAGAALNALPLPTSTPTRTLSLTATITPTPTGTLGPTVTKTPPSTPAHFIYLPIILP